jgi:hypothetical protein
VSNIEIDSLAGYIAVRMLVSFRQTSFEDVRKVCRWWQFPGLGVSGIDCSGYTGTLLSDWLLTESSVGVEAHRNGTDSIINKCLLLGV